MATNRRRAAVRPAMPRFFGPTLRRLLELLRLLALLLRRRLARLPRPTRLGRLPVRRFAACPDAGMTTAEYAVGTVAACGFAAVLYKVVTSEAVSGAIAKLVERALDVGF